MLLVDLRYRRVAALQHRYHQAARKRCIIVCIGTPLGAVILPRMHFTVVRIFAADLEKI